MSDIIKQALRKTHYEIRKKISQSFQHSASRKICTTIKALDQYRYAKKIALYFSKNNEVDLNIICQSALLHGKICCFPAIDDDFSLSFLPATPASLFADNRYGIKEPLVERKQALALETLDIMFLPLVAFDGFGTRLGMGAGCYDRTLEEKRPALLVGVAYDIQKVLFIHKEPWDIPMDVIITERSTYWIKEKS
jgi:5-formyltetrahydrofolate cyclo-ligase